MEIPQDIEIEVAPPISKTNTPETILQIIETQPTIENQKTSFTKVADLLNEVAIPLVRMPKTESPIAIQPSQETTAPSIKLEAKPMPTQPIILTHKEPTPVVKITDIPIAKVSETTAPPDISFKKSQPIISETPKPISPELPIKYNSPRLEEKQNPQVVETVRKSKAVSNEVVIFQPTIVEGKKEKPKPKREIKVNLKKENKVHIKTRETRRPLKEKQKVLKPEIKAALKLIEKNNKKKANFKEFRRVEKTKIKRNRFEIKVNLRVKENNVKKEKIAESKKKNPLEITILKRASTLKEVFKIVNKLKPRTEIKMTDEKKRFKTKEVKRKDKVIKIPERLYALIEPISKMIMNEPNKRLKKKERKIILSVNSKKESRKIKIETSKLKLLSEIFKVSELIKHPKSKEKKSSEPLINRLKKIETHFEKTNKINVEKKVFKILILAKRLVGEEKTGKNDALIKIQSAQKEINLRLSTLRKLIKLIELINALGSQNEKAEVKPTPKEIKKINSTRISIISQAA